MSTFQERIYYGARVVSVSLYQNVYRYVHKLCDINFHILHRNSNSGSCQFSLSLSLILLSGGYTTSTILKRFSSVVTIIVTMPWSRLTMSALTLYQSRSKTFLISFVLFSIAFVFLNLIPFLCCSQVNLFFLRIFHCGF